MPIPTPFHKQTLKHCESMRWKDWGGYHAVCYYRCADEEYYALRHAAGMIDVSPLFKYDISGPDAGRFLDRIMVKPVSKLKPGQVTYLCWCDDDGMLIDDGTVTCFNEQSFLVTAAEPSLFWFARLKRNYNVTITDKSADIGALSIQGPYARAALQNAVDDDISSLRFFRSIPTTAAGVPIHVSRTGYTGDLGYEVWVPAADADKVYEHILAAGRAYRLLPAGLDAMDITRVEAGFIMNGVDYFSANHCLIDERKSSPFEVGLGWTVKTDRDPFIGQAALKAAKQRGTDIQLVGLDIDWEETEELFGRFDLPPEICSAAWRDGRPVYDLTGEFIGKATSGTWSPILKKNIALASIYAPFAKPGNRLKIEMTVEYQRLKVSAIVVPTPFFNPERKRQTNVEKV